MVFYEQSNIAKETAASSIYPNNIYIPLNTGRTVPNQLEGMGRFKDQRPAQSVELTDWIKTSLKSRRILTNYNAVRTVAANYTADPAIDSVFIVSTSSTITLPDPATYVGWTFHVRSLSGATTTLDPVSTIQIDGGNTASVTAGNSGTWVATSTAYWKIS